ncbi:unnamed protein product, partial [marine sediment metagenome]
MGWIDWILDRIGKGSSTTIDLDQGVGSYDLFTGTGTPFKYSIS